MNVGELRDKDYGLNKNIEIYGSKIPPLLDIKKINDANIPIALFVGKHDILVKTEDSRWV